MKAEDVGIFLESLGFRHWPGADVLYLDMLGRVTISGLEAAKCDHDIDKIKALLCARFDNLLLSFKDNIEMDKEKVMRGERLTPVYKPTEDEDE